MNIELKDVYIAIQQMLSDSGFQNIKIYPEIVLEYLNKNNKNES